MRWIGGRPTSGSLDEQIKIAIVVVVKSRASTHDPEGAVRPSPRCRRNRWRRATSRNGPALDERPAAPGADQAGSTAQAEASAPESKSRQEDDGEAVIGGAGASKPCSRADRSPGQGTAPPQRARWPWRQRRRGVGPPTRRLLKAGKAVRRRARGKVSVGEARRD